MIQKMLFRDFSIFSSNGYFVWRSRTVCAILVEGIEEHSSEIISKFVKEKVVLKKMFIQEGRWAKTNHNSSP